MEGVAEPAISAASAAAAGQPAPRKRLRPTTLDSFLGSSGQQQQQQQAGVLIEIIHRQGRGNAKMEKHYVRDNAELAAKLPFLSKVLALQPNSLPEQHATQLLNELRADVRANWRPEKRVVAGREIEPKRCSLIVHDTGRGDGEHDGGFVNQASPLLQSPAFLEATRAVEGYVNREKHRWPEYHLYKNERWEATFIVGNSYKDRTEEVQAHSDSLALLGPLPIIAGLSFGATRVFRLNEILPAEPGKKASASNIDYDIHLPHNTLYVMLPMCQEQFKHSVPARKDTQHFPLHPIAGEERISLTYRCNRRHEIPPCTVHGTLAILHVVQSGRFDQYVWECDWARHTQRCNFRKRWTDPPTVAPEAASAASAAGDDEEEEEEEEEKEKADGAAAGAAGGAGEDRAGGGKKHDAVVPVPEPAEEVKKKAVPEIVVIDDDD